MITLGRLGRNPIREDIPRLHPEDASMVFSTRRHTTKPFSRFFEQAVDTISLVAIHNDDLRLLRGSRDHRPGQRLGTGHNNNCNRAGCGRLNDREACIFPRGIVRAESMTDGDPASRQFCDIIRRGRTHYANVTIWQGQQSINDGSG